MKLIRFGEQNEEKPGVLDINGKRKDVSHLFKDWDRECFQKYGFAEISNSRKDISSLPDLPENAILASCVARPGEVQRMTQATRSMGMEHRTRTKTASTTSQARRAREFAQGLTGRCFRQVSKHPFRFLVQDGTKDTRSSNCALSKIGSLFSAMRRAMQNADPASR